MNQLNDGTIGSAIDRALGSYARFSALDIPDDAKGFAAHHAACKAAVAHIDALLRLSRWTATDESKDDTDLAGMLSEAEDEVRRYDARDEE